MTDSRMTAQDAMPDDNSITVDEVMNHPAWLEATEASRIQEKQRLQRDAALVALKRQAEWHDMPQPSVAEIQTRINQVCQYDTGNDSTLVAMKEIVLLQLSMRLQVKELQEA